MYRAIAIAAIMLFAVTASSRTVEAGETRGRWVVRQPVRSYYYQPSRYNYRPSNYYAPQRHAAPGYEYQFNRAEARTTIGYTQLFGF